MSVQMARRGAVVTGRRRRPFFDTAAWLWTPIPASPVLKSNSASIVTGLAAGSHGVSLYDYGVAMRHTSQITPATARSVPTIVNYPAWGDPAIRNQSMPFPNGVAIPLASDGHYTVADPINQKVYGCWKAVVTRSTSVTFVKQSTPTIITGTGGTASFPSATTSGNLLVMCIAGDKNTGNLTASGWTIKQLTSTSVCNYLCWKVSAGETSVSVSWASSSAAGNRVVMFEYSDAQSGSWTDFGYASSNTTEAAVLTCTTGTATATGNGVAFAHVAGDSEVDISTSTDRWLNGFTELYSDTSGTNAAGAYVATKIISTGDTNVQATRTYAGTPDQQSGQVIILGRTSSTASTTGTQMHWGEMVDLHGDGRETTAGSSTGAGISIYACTIRQAELAAGVIPHALAFSTDIVELTNFNYPAVKTDGSNIRGYANPIREGARIQLDPTINVAAISSITPGEVAIGVALQKYGAYCIDNTSGIGMGFPFEYSGSATINDSVGFPEDFNMTHIPWSSLRVLNAWHGG